jgi:fatty-acid peroxygenase
LPLSDSEVKEKADLFSAMVVAFGASARANGKKNRRKKRKKWIQALIESVRAGKL